MARVLAVVLMLNMLTPVLYANQLEDGYAKLCTSAGLVKISLQDDTDTLSSADEADRCPYCQFTEASPDFSVNGLSYPKPDSRIEFAYLTPQLTPLTQHLLNHVHLRAPPASF